MVPPESPATSTVQTTLASQLILLLSPDPHAVFALLMTNPREPSIPHSVHKTERSHINDPVVGVARSAPHIG